VPAGIQYKNNSFVKELLSLILFLFKPKRKMKRLLSDVFIASVFIFVLLCSCKKDSFPAATQTGKGTFAAYVNGSIFKQNGTDPSGSMLKSDYYYNSIDGSLPIGYYFTVSGVYKDKNTSSYIVIHSNVMKIEEGKTYPLSEDTVNSVYARYVFVQEIENPGGTGSKEFSYQTTTGELNIAKLDTAQRIVSGSFWFDAADTTDGNKVQVRNGVFDVKY